MLRIGFIHPSNKHNYDRFRDQPLVELYLLTIIEQRFGDAVDPSLIDLRGIDDRYVFNHIPEMDVYMYSISTPDFPEFYNILKNLRLIYPDARHVAGGPHINIFPEQSSSLFDIIVLGEGEESIIKVISDILINSPRHVYAQEGHVDLSAYPYPLRKYLPKTAVANRGMLPDKNSGLLGTEVIFSRGCPGRCHFCANIKLNFGPVRYRRPNLITAEIEYLKREYNIRALVLRDDISIPLNPKIARQFLEAIRKTDVKWRGMTRANGVHPDMVKLAYESGCTDIAIGLESVSPRALKLINKGIDLGRAVEYTNLLQNTGIGVRLNIILGLPGEPEDIVKQTLKFIDETNPKSVMLSILCPMPGSEMFENPARFGIEIDTTDWDRYHVVFGRFDPKELPDMVFHYSYKCPWGTGNKKEKIIQNYIELQGELRDRGLIF